MAKKRGTSLMDVPKVFFQFWLMLIKDAQGSVGTFLGDCSKQEKLYGIYGILLEDAK